MRFDQVGDSAYLDELVQIYAEKLECNAHVVSEIKVI